MRVGRGTLGPGAALLLVLVLASIDVAAPQYMSAGVEWKAGATIPSFAISGRDAVVTVHGQNFCPGGPRCEYCDFDPPQQLCGFSGDDDGVRFLMRYIDASHVACDVTAGESSKLRGFASASYSQNKGSDWTYLDRGDNLAIVNWANAPVTRRAIAPFAPAGMPVTLQGDEMVPDGDVARMGCAFDGGAAVDLSDSNQAQLSSTLTRCEVPSGVPSSAVIDVAVEPLGTAGSTPDGDKRAGASWVQVPWVIPSRVVSNSFAAAAGSEPATVEGGGGTFTAELTVWDTSSHRADGDARERLAAASAALGCRFGTIRVAGVRDVGAGVQSALRSNVAGAFECVAPALAPRARGPRGSTRKVPFAVGATHAEVPWVGGGGGSSDDPPGLVVVAGFAGRSGGAGIAAPGPTSALVGRGGSSITLVGSFEGSRGLALRCATAGRGFDWDSRKGSSVRAGEHEFECEPDAHPRGGFYALTAWPASASGVDRWGPGLADGAWSSHGPVVFIVREEPSVLSIYPGAVATGGSHANVPLTVVGVNLPTRAGTSGDDGGVNDAWCVGFGIGGYVAATPARPVSSAVMTCPPFDSEAINAWATTLSLSSNSSPKNEEDRGDDSSSGPEASGGSNSKGSGSFVRVEAAWHVGGDLSRGASRSSVGVEIESLRVPLGPNALTPSVLSAEGGGVVAVVWSEGDKSDGDGSLHAGLSCSFGTISGISARIVENVEWNAEGISVKTHRPTCVAPSTGTRRDGVPLRVTWRSRASHPRDVVGYLDFVAPIAVSVRGSSLDSSDSDDANGFVAAAAWKAYPPAFTNNGGSLTSVRIERGGLSVPIGSPTRCVFVVQHGGGSGGKESIAIADVTGRSSSTIATCEVPSLGSFHGNSMVDDVTGVALGSVALLAGALGTHEQLEAAVSTALESAKVSVSWVETPVVHAASPGVAAATGGRSITVTGRDFGVAERARVWVGTIGPLNARSIDPGDDSSSDHGDVLEFIAPAANFDAFVRPVSVGGVGVATRSGIEPSTPGLRYARAYRCDVGGDESACVAMAPSAAASTAGGDVTTALLAGVFDAYSPIGDHSSSSSTAGRMWTASGKRRVSLALRTDIVGHPSFATWRVPAVSANHERASGGWSSVFLNLGSGDEAAGRLLAFAPPKTSSRGANPRVVPVGGGGIVWLTGSDMRPPTDAPEGALFGCVVDDSTGKKIGSLRPISSALAVCETPAVAAPSPALAAYAGYVYTLDGESVVTDAGGGGFGHDRGEAPPTIAALEGVTAYASSTPAAVRGAWGGDTLILALTRDVHIEASSSSSSGSDVSWGCRVGTIGPMAGVIGVNSTSSGSSTGSLRCVAPASAPGTYPVSLAPHPGGFTDPNPNPNPLTVAYAPARAGDGDSRMYSDSALFASPSRVAVAPVGGIGGGHERRAFETFRVTGGGALVSLAFAASEATARGLSNGGGVRCVVGGRETSSLIRLNDEGFDSLDDRLSVSCALAPGIVRPGFTTVHVAWYPPGTASGSHVAAGSSSVSEFFSSSPAGSVSGFERPTLRSIRPEIGVSAGGGVASISGTNLALNEYQDALRCVFGGVAVDVGSAVSSALVRCEVPASLQENAGRTFGGSEPVVLSVAPWADAGTEKASDAAHAGSPDADGSVSSPATSAKSTAVNSDNALVFARVRSRPSVRSTRPGVVGEAGGDFVTFTGSWLKSALGACTCEFGSIKSVAASSCRGGEARCVVPAMRPRIGGVRTRLCSDEGVCSEGDEDAGESGVSLSQLDVVAGLGQAESVMPPMASSVGGAVAIGARVSLHGWGLRRDTARIDDGGGGKGANDALLSALGAIDATLCAFATAPGLVAPVPAAASTTSDDTGRIDCVFRSLPPSGFHVVSLSSTSMSSASSLGDGDHSGYRGGVQILVRGAPRLRAASPARSPATGGGVLWIAGGDLHGDWSDGVGGGGFGEGTNRACAFGGVVGVAASARVVSSALVSCEIPPRGGRGGVSGDVAAAVSLLTRGADDSYPEGESDGFSGLGTDSGLSSGSNHSLVSGGVLWVEYIADGAGVADGFPIKPSRGPVFGGTTVTMRLWRVSGGWTFARGYRGAGCRFGSVQVAARWAKGADAECVSPSRGVLTAAVEASIVADWRTHSFLPPKLEQDGRVYYRYTKF